MVRYYKGKLLIAWIFHTTRELIYIKKKKKKKKKRKEKKRKESILSPSQNLLQSDLTWVSSMSVMLVNISARPTRIDSHAHYNDDSFV